MFRQPFGNHFAEEPWRDVRPAGQLDPLQVRRDDERLDAVWQGVDGAFQHRQHDSL